MCFIVNIGFNTGRGLADYTLNGPFQFAIRRAIENSSGRLVIWGQPLKSPRRLVGCIVRRRRRRRPWIARLRKHICWWLKCGVLRWPLDHNVIVKALRVSYLATTRALSIKLRFLSFAKPEWLINVSRVITFCFVCCCFFLYLLLANFKVNCLQHISFQIVCICICLKNKYSCPSGLFFNSSLRRKMLRSLCFKPVDLFT